MKAYLILAALALVILSPLYFYFGAAEKADFTYVCESEPETLDPGLITGVTEGRIVDSVFEGLTVCHPAKLDILPGVAEKWEVSEDGLTYTFHLRESFWSDGVPVKAGDFYYAWRRVLTPETASDYAYLFYCIKNARKYYEGEIKDFGEVGILAPDDHTFVVRLEQPTAYFLQLTSFSTFLPLRRDIIEKYGPEWIKPGRIVSNGAFIVSSRKINSEIILKKNTNYWDRQGVSLDTIRLLISDNVNTAFNIYETGGADLITSLPSYIIDRLAGRKDYVTYPYLGTYFYRMNVARAPFDDQRVRKAFALSVDRDKITKYITRGGEIPAYSFVPPGIPGYEPSRLLSYDPEKARALLAEAGYPGGGGFPETEIIFNTSEGHLHIAEVLQSMWKEELGVKVKLLNQEWKVYLNTVSKMDYSMARASWIGDYVYPSTFLEMFITGGGNNNTGWTSGEFDALIDKCAKMPAGSERNGAFADAEKILLEDMPIIPLYYYVVKNMVKPGVTGVYDNIRNIILFKYIKKEGK